MAVQLLQRMISALGSKRLVIDGKMGPKSYGALGLLPLGAQELVYSTAKRLGVELPELISLDKARQIAASVSRQTGVPLSYLMLTLDLENPQVGSNYVNELEGTFRGLGQFNQKTWVSVSEQPWSEVRDPWASMRAIASLYLENRKYHFSRLGLIPYTDEIAYLYHNQGASSAEQYLKSGKLRYPKQSARAIQTFAKAKRQKDEYKNRTIA